MKLFSAPHGAQENDADTEILADRNENPVRVLHLITSLNRGGAENHLLSLVTHPGSGQFHYEVAVLRSTGELIAQFRNSGVRVHDLGAGWGIDFRAVGRLRHLIQEGGFEIVHSHLFRADVYGSLALMGAGGNRPRFLSTRHNDDRFFLHPFVGMVHYILSSQQDMIIAISDHVARFTIARGVTDPQRVRRVYHGLDPLDETVRERERQEVRREIGVGPDDYLVGNVGRLAPQKGQRHLITALPSLLKRVPRAHLAIVGAGELEPYLRELAEEAGVPDRVHVLGPRRDVPRVMQAFDVFAMPSIWEGFGIVLLEAMAATRPIVASHVATIPEVVSDGETGLLVPPGDPDALADALARLAEAPEEAHRMGQAGRLRLSQLFTRDKMVGDTESLYSELIDRA